jgi:hypothetical protein
MHTINGFIEAHGRGAGRSAVPKPGTPESRVGSLAHTRWLYGPAAAVQHEGDILDWMHDEAAGDAVRSAYKKRAERDTQ